MKQEESLQRACVKWFRYAYPKLTMFAPMNEGVRGKVKGRGGQWFSPEGTRAKAMGKMAGVADLFIMYAAKGYHGLFVELKAPKGRQVATQKEFQTACEGAGYKYLVIKDVDSFISEVQSYVKN